MKINIEQALAEAKERLEKTRSRREKWLKEVREKDIEEPDHLRSGFSLDELSIKRILKEQENDDPTR